MIDALAIALNFSLVVFLVAISVWIVMQIAEDAVWYVKERRNEKALMAWLDSRGRKNGDD